MFSIKIADKPGTKGAKQLVRIHKVWLPENSMQLKIVTSKIEQNRFNEDDDNLIYLGSIPENTQFSSNPETCYYVFLLSLSYLSMAHFHDT